MLSTEYQKILHRTRPVSGRHPMAVEKRAKQFAPFAALKGFRTKSKSRRSDMRKSGSFRKKNWRNWTERSIC